MNKIIVEQEKVIKKSINKQLDIEIISSNGIFSINKIIINVIKDSKLCIDYILDNNKYDITINIMPNINFSLYEIKKGEKSKIQYTFNIYENSNVYIQKINNISNHKEMIITNFNGNNSCFNYNLSSISTSKESYDMVISNNINSICNINNNILNINEGKVSVQISHYIDKDMKNCIINQNNNIINLTNNKCDIRPNFYINEPKVSIRQNNNINSDRNNINELLLNNLDDNMKNIVIKTIKNIGGDYYQ